LEGCRKEARTKIGRKRVADAGDIGSGEASPYDTEAQADSIAKQTDRKSRIKTKRKDKQSSR
jgi:hypothetical protein